MNSLCSNKNGYFSNECTYLVEMSAITQKIYRKENIYIGFTGDREQILLNLNSSNQILNPMINVHHVLILIYACVMHFSFSCN